MNNRPGNDTYKVTAKWWFIFMVSEHACACMICKASCILWCLKYPLLIYFFVKYFMSINSIQVKCDIVVIVITNLFIFL